ncbi:hypothetical protein TNCV_1536901 [Trichonephila clavipes]|nr:hypothetical protein TNCV_1536901 [Trichonephila clavipes]
MTQFNGLRRQGLETLRHPIPGAKLCLWIDASDKAVGGSLMELHQNDWEPIAFFVSEALETSAETVHI